MEYTAEWPAERLVLHVFGFVVASSVLSYALLIIFDREPTDQTAPAERDSEPARATTRAAFAERDIRNDDVGQPVPEILVGSPAAGLSLPPDAPAASALGSVPVA